MFNSTAAGDVPVASCTFSIFSNGVCRIRFHPPQPVRQESFIYCVSTGSALLTLCAAIATAIRAGAVQVARVLIVVTEAQPDWLAVEDVYMSMAPV